MPSALPLTELAIGDGAEIVGLDLDERDVAWLAAIGLAVGERVEVLRRAPFGGPLHLRTHAGVEFAVGGDIAAKLMVTRA